MKKTLLTLLCIGLLGLSACGQSVEPPEPNADTQQTVIQPTDTTAASDDSLQGTDVQQTDTTDASNDSLPETDVQQKDTSGSVAYNLREDSYVFEMLWNITTGPNDSLQIGRDMTNAYPGMPFQVAKLNADGEAVLVENIVYFPAICDQEAAAILLIADGHYGASISYAPELTAYLKNGGKAAIVIGGGAVYAISEDDAVTVLTETPGEESIVPMMGFAEASQFNNVVSLDTLTQEFTGENSEEVLGWIYGN
ncbi:MAG: hypothetical protein IJN11_02455 [Oscillospiraceae bacterium]|nr:hypothetical protein [Oscillospiraceae bacterium]